MSRRIALVFAVALLSGCAAPRWDQADIRDAVSIADGVFPPQGVPVPSLASLGATLQAVTDEGATTTTAITATGANLFSANGVTTTFTGTTNVTIVDGTITPKDVIDSTGSTRLGSSALQMGNDVELWWSVNAGYAAGDTFMGRVSGAPGTVFIGATTGTADGVLDISGGGTATALKLPAGALATLALTLGETSTGLYLSAANTMQVVTDGAIAFTIDAGGNVDHRGDIRIRDGKPIRIGTGFDRFLQGEGTTLTDGVATEFIAIQSALGDAGGVVITYTIKVTTATGVQQSETGTVTISTADGASGVAVSTPGEVSSQALEAGTMTTAFAIDNTDDGDLEISVNANTTLTPTAMTISWTADCSGDVTLVAP